MKKTFTLIEPELIIRKSVREKNNTFIKRLTYC